MADEEPAVRRKAARSQPADAAEPTGPTAVSVGGGALCVTLKLKYPRHVVRCRRAQPAAHRV
jgi:hypothetical protein